MCITYPVSSCKLATSFSTISIFIFSGKNGKPLSKSVPLTFPQTCVDTFCYNTNICALLSHL